MGRLPPLIGLLALALSACDSDTPAPTAPKARAAAVQATAAPTTPSARPAPSIASAKATTKRELCKGQLESKPRDLPKKATLSRAGKDKPPADLPVGDGKWTWLNFWAAWCVPCKEEIPRLSEWRSKLSTKMELVFVSLDDDERQLETFIEKQPVTGLRSTYWLRDGKERQEWLAEAALEVDPELPMHVLVDPRGKLRCTINGAVDDSDYDRVAEIVGK
jgi:thiol-disulfide isomerase/thioredoxin